MNTFTTFFTIIFASAAFFQGCVPAVADGETYECFDGHILIETKSQASADRAVAFLNERLSDDLCTSSLVGDAFLVSCEGVRDSGMASVTSRENECIEDAGEARRATEESFPGDVTSAGCRNVCAA